ncbi:MAG: type III-B CRISPR-associated protein Cas10/Cmr2 [Acidobacteriota bacterium]
MSSSSSGSAIYWSVALIPVQDWIADARRSRDLRVGSAFLSWTMARILSSLKTDMDASVLLPHETSTGLFAGIANSSFAQVLEKVEYSLPNRASGHLPDGSTVEDAKKFFHDVISQCPGRAWAKLIDAIRVRSGSGRGADKETWQKVAPWLGNVPAPVQAVWCIKRVRGEDGLKGIDDLFSALKRTRPLPPPNNGAPVGKCTQCGKREAIGAVTWHEWRSFQDQLDELPDVKHGYRLDAGERLCTVCCVKRFAGYLSDTPFPSTSEIAARHWHALLRNRGLMDDLDRLAREVPDSDQVQGGDTFTLYFPRTLDRKLHRATFQPDAGIDPRQATALERVKAVQSELRAAVLKCYKTSTGGAAPKPDPSNYLAVVTFDGDNMGEKVQQHAQVLPQKLMQFASALGAHIIASHAEAFYLGGDEGLILCPIETVLDLVEIIHKEWHGNVTETTLSAGVAIFDRERPLGAAIEAARAAVETAKRLDRKDGLAVCVQTASGSEWMAVDHWGESWDRLRSALKLLCDGRISAGWPFDVEEFLRELPDSAWQVTATRNAIRTEMRRLTKRSTHDEDPERIWRDELRGEEWFEKAPDPVTIVCLSDQLHLLAFLSRESRA